MGRDVSGTDGILGEAPYGTSFLSDNIGWLLGIPIAVPGNPYNLEPLV